MSCLLYTSTLSQKRGFPMLFSKRLTLAASKPSCSIASSLVSVTPRRRAPPAGPCKTLCAGGIKAPPHLPARLPPGPRSASGAAAFCGPPRLCPGREGTSPRPSIPSPSHPACTCGKASATGYAPSRTARSGAEAFQHASSCASLFFVQYTTKHPFLNAGGPQNRLQKPDKGAIMTKDNSMNGESRLFLPSRRERRIAGSAAEGQRPKFPRERPG